MKRKPATPKAARKYTIDPGTRKGRWTCESEAKTRGGFGTLL